MKSLCFVLLAAVFSLPVWSQGIVVCKKDGTRMIFPYETIDSVLTYNYDEEPPMSGDIDVEFKMFTVNGVSFKMIAVEGGTFTMGATAEQIGARSEESPSHQVTLSPYYIGETEVTQALWEAVTGYSPTADVSWTSHYGLGDSYPAYYISYNDVKNFIAKLNEMTGMVFRMPTEAEWEYAARGGNKSKSYLYSGGNSIGDVAWVSSNSGGKTNLVGTKSPNELGLYDMSGNVWEWCSDWFGSYSSANQTDPTGPSSGKLRIMRGGSWPYNGARCRVAYRGYIGESYCDYDCGVRLAFSSSQ